MLHCQNPECNLELDCAVIAFGWYLCKLCHAMLEVVGRRAYWVREHQLWFKEETERIKNLRKLKPGGDYLASEGP